MTDEGYLARIRSTLRLIGGTHMPKHDANTPDPGAREPRDGYPKHAYV